MHFFLLLPPAHPSPATSPPSSTGGTPFLLSLSPSYTHTHFSFPPTPAATHCRPATSCRWCRSWLDLPDDAHGCPTKSHTCCYLAYPVVHVADRWMDTWFSTHKGFLIQRLHLQKASGQVVRTHPPMVLLAMVKERYINQLAFY